MPGKVDKDFIPGLMYIRDNEATSEEFEAMGLPFTVPSASGQDVQLSSRHSHISLDTRAEYVRLAVSYRCGQLCEGTQQASCPPLRPAGLGALPAGGWGGGDRDKSLGSLGGWLHRLQAVLAACGTGGGGGGARGGAPGHLVPSSQAP